MIGLLAAGASWGQQVVVKNNGTTDRPVIALKWYSEAINYPGGVNIYRQKVGVQGWVKLNDTPLMMMDTVSAEAYEADSTLRPVVEIVKNVPKRDIIKNGFLKLTVLLKTFQSNVFSGFLGIYHEDTTVEAGSVYRYRVNRIIRGRELLVGESQLLQAGDPYAFDPPADFEALQEAQQVILNWKIEENRFYGVNIYRSEDDATYEKLNQLPVMVSQVYNKEGQLVYPEKLYTDRNVKTGNKYYYKIEALNFFGDVSTRSEARAVEIMDMTPPPAPKKLERKGVSQLQVTLTWKKVKSDKIHGYNVYRSENSKGPFNLASTFTIDKELEEHTDTVPAPGNYYYFITSLGTNGVEAPSNYIHVEVPDVFPPATPENLTAKADTGRVILSWDANNETDMKGYWIYRSILNSEDNHFVLLNSTPQMQTQYEDALPKNARNKFVYKLVAVDTSFNTSGPTGPVAVGLPDVSPPQTPFLTDVEIFDEKNIRLTWKPNVDQDLKGYKIFRAEPSSDFEEIFEASNARSDYIDTRVKSGEAYRYLLKAVDSAGNTSFSSNIKSIRMEIDRAPSVSEVKNLNLKQVDGRKVQVKWNIRNTADLLGAVVYRKKANGTLTPVSPKLSADSWTDDSVVPGASYSYQVRAYYKKGFIGKSDMAEITID